MQAQSGNVYMLIEREFIQSKRYVYKVGKTSRPLGRRVAQYPKGSEVLISMWTPDITTTETIILQHFKRNFRHRPEYGREYFSGHDMDMMNDFHMLVIFCASLHGKHDDEELINEICEKASERGRIIQQCEKNKKDNIKNEKLITQLQNIQPVQNPATGILIDLTTEDENDVIYLGEINIRENSVIDLTQEDEFEEIEARLARLKF